jgi:hypothetical protein
LTSSFASFLDDYEYRIEHRLRPKDTYFATMMYSKLLFALAISSGMVDLAVGQDNGTLALDPNNVQDGSKENGLATAEEGELPSDT